MWQEIQIALRNLNRQRRRTILLGGAIAFGIMIVTVINGFAGSFVQNVSENFANILAGHLFVEGVEADGNDRFQVIREDSELMSALEASGIPWQDVTRRSSFNGEVIFAGQSLRQNITGVDWDRETYLQQRLVLFDGSFDNMLRRNDAGERNGLIISSDIAERLNVQMEDIVLLRLQTIGGQQNVGEFRIAGISFDPQLFGSISLYADISYVNELIGLGPGEYQTMGIFLEEIPQIPDAVEAFYAELQQRELQLFPRATEEEDENPVAALFDDAEEETWEGLRYRVYTLNDLLAEIDEIVNLLNGAAFIILLVLFVIIMVGITNTFRMIMFERIREIGTMRALGMQRVSVTRQFLFEALFLALGGAFAGLAIAGVLMAITSLVDFGLDNPLFILMRNGRLTFRLEFLQVLFNFTVVGALTVLAALIPTRRAVMMPPVEALGSVH